MKPMGGGVKPFDPSKSYKTLVVDITNDNFAKSGDRKNTVLRTILERAFNKTENVADDGKSLSITNPFTIDWKESEGGGKIQKFRMDLTDNKNNVVKIEAQVDSDGNLKTFESFDKKQCYIIFTVDGDYYDKETGDTKYKYSQSEFLGRKNGRFLIFPMDDGDSKDFILNSKWLVYHHTDPNKNSAKRVYETTLGCLAALAASDFKNLAVLEDSNAGKPQNIAKALGYEIPDNYTPGQGVEKTKA